MYSIQNMNWIWILNLKASNNMKKRKDLWKKIFFFQAVPVKCIYEKWHKSLNCSSSLFFYCPLFKSFPFMFYFNLFAICFIEIRWHVIIDMRPKYVLTSLHQNLVWKQFEIPSGPHLFCFLVWHLKER